MKRDAIIVAPESVCNLWCHYDIKYTDVVPPHTDNEGTEKLNYVLDMWNLITQIKLQNVAFGGRLANSALIISLVK